MNIEHGSSVTLVWLGILVAIFASFTALNLSGRIAAAEPSARRWWIMAAAGALGGGTWTMHFVGMLAMSMPAVYNGYLTLISLVLPIVVSGIGLHIVSRLPDSRAALAGSGLLVGSGVAAMHYTGMAAMEMPGLLISYDWRLVAASVAIAVAAATAALWLAFRISGSWQRGVAAIVMGGAISGMHYTGMTAASFTMDHRLAAAVSPGISKEILALGVIGAATFLLLLALVTAFFDRKLATLTMREADALQRSEERYRLLIESSSDIIGIIDADGFFVYESSSASHVLGYSTDEIVGKHFTDFVTTDGRADAARFFAGVLDRPAETLSAELSLIHRSGGLHPFELAATNLLHAPQIAGIVVNLRSIAERTQLLDRLKMLSETDQLTKALNRRGFSRLAEREFERARRAGEKLAIVMMDIDHFKRVNDHYGHAAGDLVLAKVADACASHIREGDLLGRMGGEEFALLLTGRGTGMVSEIVDRLRERVAVCAVPTIRGDVSVTASFGIACADPATTGLATALNQADRALYEAKEAGRNCVKVRA